MTVQEGTILLGKYRVEKELGRGAMGYVVAARHEHLGELFALKLMLPEALERPDAAGRFLREARACARLKSEHVVRVTDSGANDDGVPVMVMEYLVGEDLQTVLDKRKVFPVHEAVSYVLQACEAIAEAHDLGILHRDLKPSNLFLTQRPNGKPCVKVLDFGISKDLNPEGRTVAKLTATGSILGTPFYMSPEQMQGKTIDHRGDIWSLGVILYEFVTGQLPFPGDSYAQIAGSVLHEKPISPSGRRPSVPVRVNDIILRCLEKKPEDRFSSVRELTGALEAVLEFPSAPVASLVPDTVDAEMVKDTVELQITKPADDEKVTIIREKDKGLSKLLAAEDILKTLPSAMPPPSAVLRAAAAAKPVEVVTDVPVFYAKRVFGPQSGKKTWASTSQAGRRDNKRVIFFALVVIGLIAVVWLYKDSWSSAMKAWSARKNAASSSSAMPEHSSELAPELSASIAPSSSAPPRITSKPRSSSHAAPKTSGAASATPSAAAKSSSEAPAPSAATPAPTPANSQGTAPN